jgi:DNA polymerase-3 subunit delta
MTVAELKNAIKSSELSGAYIFAGEEDYLKKYYLGSFRDIICPDEAFALFNHSVFDGGEIDFAAVAEAIKSPPMMGDLKLVEWRYPELDSLNESERKKLLELASLCEEYPYAVLVFLTSEDGFDAGSAKRPSKLASKLAEKFKLVIFEKSTDVQLLGWLKKHFDAEGIGADAKALSALIFRSGHSMQVLKNEVDKLCAYAKANSLTALTEEQILHVAAPTLECDAFALSGAITDKNREKAFTALMDMKQRRIEAGAVIATLARTFGELVTVSMLLDEGKDTGVIESTLKWNSYKIKICINSARKWGTARLADAASRLRELDAASKSGGVMGFTPIEIFVSSYIR